MFLQLTTDKPINYLALLANKIVCLAPAWIKRRTPWYWLMVIDSVLDKNDKDNDRKIHYEISQILPQLM